MVLSIDLQSRSLDLRNWAVIHLSATNDIHNQGNNKHTNEQNNTPVEGVECNWDSVGPERPEERERNVYETDNVDGDTPLSETPARCWDELWVRNAAVENASHGDSVSHHDCADLERDNSVESGCRAEVDKRKENSDYASESNRIRRNVLLGIDMSDPFGEWETVVPSEGECLTSSRCVP